MSKTDDGAVKILPGTQEHLTREHFAKEKAAYEKRTGETVSFELDHPVTSTPLNVAPKDRSKAGMKDLKAEAAALGIELEPKATKAVIITAIEAKLAEAADSDETEDKDAAAEGEGV